MPSSQKSPSHQRPLVLESHATASRLEIEELDESGNVLGRYFRSLTTSKQDSSLSSTDGPRRWREGEVGGVRGREMQSGNVQVMNRVQSYSKTFVEAFLPVGFPDSVTEDYLEYQIYDSLQAFSSSIAGMLSSRAVLEGIGVGSTHTTPTAALLLSILQSSLGRLATIAFASQMSSSLEPECKAYRFLADIFNDLAILLDCISPALSTTGRVSALCGASVLRSLCGVAAGSAKASLSAHFAKRGNVGELAAKDSSQETVISLMGMLVGSLLVPYITSVTATWISLLLLIGIHLYTNYRAVRAVRLPSLNCQRANLVFSSLLASIKASSALVGSDKNLQKHFTLKTKVLRLPRPTEVYLQERIFEIPSRLRYRGEQVIGACHLGVPVSSFLGSMSATSRQLPSGVKQSSQDELAALLELYQEVEYILWLDVGSRRVSVVFKEDGRGQRVFLKAWFNAMLVAWAWERSEKVGKRDVDGRRVWGLLEESVTLVHREWSGIEEVLERSGWDIDVEAILARGKARVRIKSS